MSAEIIEFRDFKAKPKPQRFDVRLRSAHEQAKYDPSKPLIPDEAAIARMLKEDAQQTCDIEQ